MKLFSPKAGQSYWMWVAVQAILVKSYKDAHWDSISEVRKWHGEINHGVGMVIKSTVLMPSTGIIARMIETLLPDYFPYASFMAVSIKNKTNG